MAGDGKGRDHDDDKRLEPGDPADPRKLLTGRLIFTPDEDDLGRFYTFEGRADRLQPIRGTVRAARALVTPGGSARRGRRDADSDTLPCSAWNLVVDLATTITVDAA
jgi:hypothetical protein